MPYPLFSQKKNFLIHTFLAWTTTPWRLPSNTALVVGSKIKYSIVQTFNRYTAKKTKCDFGKQSTSPAYFGKGFIEVNSNQELNTWNKKDKNIPFYVTGIKWKRFNRTKIRTTFSLLFAC